MEMFKRLLDKVENRIFVEIASLRRSTLTSNERFGVRRSALISNEASIHGDQRRLKIAVLVNVELQRKVNVLVYSDRCLVLRISVQNR